GFQLKLQPVVLRAVGGTRWFCPFIGNRWSISGQELCSGKGRAGHDEGENLSWHVARRWSSRVGLARTAWMAGRGGGVRVFLSHRLDIRVVGIEPISDQTSRSHQVHDGRTIVAPEHRWWRDDGRSALSLTKSKRV